MVQTSVFLSLEKGNVFRNLLGYKLVLAGITLSTCFCNIQTLVNSLNFDVHVMDKDSLEIFLCCVEKYSCPHFDQANTAIGCMFTSLSF